MNLDQATINRLYASLIRRTEDLIETKGELEKAKRSLKFAIANYTARGLIMQAPEHGKNKEQREAHAEGVLSHHYAAIDQIERTLIGIVRRYEVARLRLQELKLAMQLEGMNLEAQRIKGELLATNQMFSTSLPISISGLIDRDLLALAIDQALDDPKS